MKSLQEYLIEELEYNDVNEGKIWDAIKEWFANLFSPSTKKYDRFRYDPDEYDKIFRGDNIEKYKKYLTSNFKLDKCKLMFVEQKNVKKIIAPNDMIPNEDDKLGFYKFIEDCLTKELNKNDMFFALCYEDAEVKDVLALIKGRKDKFDLNLLKVQIITEYEKLIKLQNVIEFLLNSKDILKDKDFVKVKCLEKDNKELYNKLLNDCDFTKENNLIGSVAVKEIKYEDKEQEKNEKVKNEKPKNEKV